MPVDIDKPGCYISALRIHDSRILRCRSRMSVILSVKNSFYLIIPFILEVGFTGSVVWGAVKYFANAKPLREYVYTATAGAFHRRALLSAVFAGVGVVSETVFLILSGEKGQAFAAAGFYLLKAAVIISMLLLRHFVRGAEWTLSAAQTKR